MDIYDPPADQTIDPTDTFVSDDGATVTVDSNCTLNAAAVNDWLADGKQIVFDTSASDLFIYLDGGTYNFDGAATGCHNEPLVVNGENSVYIYVKNEDAVTLRFTGDSNFIYGDSGAVAADGSINVNNPPRFFIYSSHKDSKIVTNGQFALPMYFYMPYGTLDVNGEPVFMGSVIVSGSKVMGTPTFKYISAQGKGNPSNTNTGAADFILKGIVTGTGEMPETTTPPVTP